MPNALFLGIDASTQGCKLVIIDTQSGMIDLVESVNFDQDLPHYQTENGIIINQDSNISEAPPGMWIEALELLFTRLKEKNFPLSQIQTISVSGQQHGLVALDEHGQLTRPFSKLWNDTSTVEECQLLTDALGGPEEMIREIGNTQRPGYTAGKIFHLYRHETEQAERTATFFLVHNYINWYLTGGIRVMEPGDVSGMALSFPGSESWSDKICQTISAKLQEKLPPVKPSDQLIGRISSDLVNRYGFSPECFIDAGSGDNMYGAVGTGNIEPGIVTISLGTSGTAYSIFNEPFVDPRGEIALFCDSTGHYMSLLCVSNLANGYNQVMKLYNLDHRAFTDILKQTPPGNEGRWLFPWFIGERTPDLPNAVPVYWGFQLPDFTMPVLCRSVLEGHILNLFDGFRRLPVKPTEIRLTGGLSNSDAWCQTIADVFDVETVPVAGEGAALGAAIHAAWVYFRKNEGEDQLKTLVKEFVKLVENRRKFPQNAGIYRPVKDAFSEIRTRLQKPANDIDPFRISADYKKIRP